MIKKTKSISVTKEKVKSFYGKDVEVKVNLGRNKFVEYYGKLTGVYPALFTISPNDNFNGKTSFSYSELMCGMVEIKVKQNNA